MYISVSLLDHFALSVNLGLWIYLLIVKHREIKFLSFIGNILVLESIAELTQYKKIPAISKVLLSKEHEIVMNPFVKINYHLLNLSDRIYLGVE